MTNSIGMQLVRIPRGTFLMGSPPTEPGREPNELQHEVTTSHVYYLGLSVVTRSQFAKVMGHTENRLSGQYYADGDRSHCPAEYVSWEEAVEFCQRLSELSDEKAAQRVYRLPTEAEWEYACRAGSQSAFCCGDSSDQLAGFAWFDENSGGTSLPICGKQPNAWGLYDMHGNVYEWCADWYDHYPQTPASHGDQVDPRGPATGEGRVCRGGCWRFEADACRSAFRGRAYPSSRMDIGFRVAMPAPNVP